MVAEQSRTIPNFDQVNTFESKAGAGEKKQGGCLREVVKFFISGNDGTCPK